MGDNLNSLILRAAIYVIWHHEFVHIAVASHELHRMSQEESDAYILCGDFNYFIISLFILNFVQIAVATNELHRMSQEESDA